MDEKMVGKLDVRLGCGYLSSFEAGIIKEGDIVRVSQMAGEPCSVNFNSTFLAAGEVVVLGEQFAVRISEMNRPGNDPPKPAVYNEVAELLPFWIGLGEIEVGLDELKGLGTGSFINLCKSFNTECDITLFIAGISLVEGKTVVLGENFGIRVMKRLLPQWQERNIRTSGFLLDRNIQSIQYKDYDFKRPDKFTKVAIKKVHRIHQDFLRNMTFVDNSFRGMEIVSVDQLAFYELMPGFERKNLTFSVASTLRAVRPYGKEAEGTHLPEKLYLEPAECVSPFSEDLKQTMEKILRNAGCIQDRPVFICTREFDLGGQFLNTLYSSLRGGWRLITDLPLRHLKTGHEISTIDLIPRNDMIIIVEMRHKDNPDKELFLVYPYITVEPFVGLLNG